MNEQYLLDNGYEIRIFGDPDKNDDIIKCYCITGEEPHAYHCLEVSKDFFGVMIEFDFWEKLKFDPEKNSINRTRDYLKENNKTFSEAMDKAIFELEKDGLWYVFRHTRSTNTPAYNNTTLVGATLNYSETSNICKKDLEEVYKKATSPIRVTYSISLGSSFLVQPNADKE